MGTLRILSILITPFLGIMVIILMLSMWSISTLSSIEDFWVDVDHAIYTFIQILTLDDWCARLLKVLLEN